MKKHVFLTSLIAISLSCGAHAATDTDVTFSGNYTNANGDTVNVNDTDETATTYKYTGFDSTAAEQTEYEVDLDSEPAISNFKYIDKNGDNTSLTTEDLPSIEDYVGTSAATEDSGVTKSDAQAIAAGATALRENYTYKVGEDDVKLGDVAPDVITTVTLDDDTKVTIKNGVAQFDDARYTVQGNEGVFTLGEDENTLIDINGNIQTPKKDSDLYKAMQEKRELYAADQEAVKDEVASNKAKYDEGLASFDAAKEVFEADEATIKTLTENYNSIAQAQNAFAAANTAYENAKTQQGAASELKTAAKNVYNAPILETIANGANDAIDMSLAEGGTINTALAEKASIADLATKADVDTVTANTTAIATNKTAIAENKAAIEKNTENIAANKKAIENETAERKAADEQLAKDIKAGDEMTLAAAKAYVDEYNSVALQAANAYTDKKVNALEKELSAGIAAATAMSSIEVSNVAKGEVSVGGGYGYYNSQSAVAFGAAMGLTDNWSVNAAAGLADSNVSFRAGTNYKFKLF